MEDKICGVICILTNPSFKEYVKIGYANDLKQRIKQLNQSEAVPYAFHAYAYYETTDRLNDLEVHSIIDKLNPNLRCVEIHEGKQRKREFYEMTKEDAYSILESVAIISGTKERLHKCETTPEAKKDEESAKEARKRSQRKPFTLTMVHIPFGSEIVFVNDFTKKAVVIDDKHILFNNVTTSLSRLAKDLLDVSYDVQGPRYFNYQGKNLNDLYEKYYPSEDLE